MKLGAAILAATLAALGTFVSARCAHADPGDACVSSYEEAQQARNAGELVRSKANLRLCSKSCPQALARDCEGWLMDVEQRIGHLELRLESKDSAPLRNARLSIDGVGVPFNDRIEIDPGPHEIRVDADDRMPAVSRVAIEPGATVRHTIRLVPQSGSNRRGQRDPALGGPITLGIAGLVVMTVAGALTIAGHVDVSNMRRSCAPGCSDRRVDTVRSLWTASGILAGVGGAAVIASGVWLGLELSGNRVEKATLGITLTF